MTTAVTTYPRTEYPRPQFERPSWVNLNGLWKFAFDDQNIGENGSWYKYAFAEGYEYKGQPVMLTEYGGIAFKDESGWGYGNQVDTEEAFLKRYRGITDAIKAIPYISGYCYTQTTDVQQGINGLLREDRTPKISLEKIKEVNDIPRPNR